MINPGLRSVLATACIVVINLCGCNKREENNIDLDLIQVADSADIFLHKDKPRAATEAELQAIKSLLRADNVEAAIEPGKEQIVAGIDLKKNGKRLCSVTDYGTGTYELNPGGYFSLRKGALMPIITAQQ